MPSVLIVEDSAAMRGLIASIVEQVEGCEVVEAAGGFDALKSLPRRTFDLIITDINMPDINGLELLSFIRRNAAHRETPVLIVTSEDSDAQRERSFALGANAILRKPFAEEDLLAKVRELL